MRFTTKSGSTYELTEINEGENGYSAYLIRGGVPLIDMATGGEMSELHAQRISYAVPPTEGQSFRYWTQTHGGAVSTPVVSFDEVSA